MRLSILIAYILTNIGAMVLFTRLKVWKIHNLIVPVIAVAALGFALYSNIYPIPAFPLNIFPYIVLAWVVFGLLLSRLAHARHALSEQTISE